MFQLRRHADRGERPIAAFGPSLRSFHQVFRFSSWVLGRTDSPWKEAVSWPRVPCSRLDGCCHTLRCKYRPRFLFIRGSCTLVPLQERLMRQRIKSHRRLTFDALMPFHDPFRSLCPGSGSWCRTVALVLGSWPARPSKVVVTPRTASFRAQRDPELVHTRRSGVAAPVPRRPAGRDRAIPPQRREITAAIENQTASTMVSALRQTGCSKSALT